MPSLNIREGSNPILLSCDYGVYSYQSLRYRYVNMQERVVMTKSVEYMPFLLSFSLSSSVLIWTCYAILVKDYSIAVSSHS